MPQMNEASLVFRSEIARAFVGKIDQAEISAVVSAPPAHRLRHITLLGNFPPRRCGIATFTADVEAALASRFPDIAVDVYAMNDEEAEGVRDPEDTEFALASIRKQVKECG